MSFQKLQSCTKVQVYAPCTDVWKPLSPSKMILVILQVAWVSTPALLQPAGATSSIPQHISGGGQSTLMTSRDGHGSANQERRMTSMSRYSPAADAWREPSDRTYSSSHRQHGMTSERRHSSCANQEYGMTSEGQYGWTDDRRRAMSLGRRRRSTNQRREHHHTPASEVWSKPALLCFIIRYTNN